MRERQLRYEVQAVLLRGQLGPLPIPVGAEWRVASMVSIVHGSDEHGLFTCKLSAEACKAQVERLTARLTDLSVEYFVNEVEVPADYNQKED